MSRVIHFEILADDPKRAANFYKDVFGWQMQGWAGGDQPYWLVTTGPEEVPGINGAIMGRHFDQRVINTAQVASLGTTLEQIEQAGGKVMHGPRDLPGIGRHAYCADTEGNLFGVLEAVET